MEVFSGLLALVAIVYAVNQHWALLFVAFFALVGIWAAYECKSGRLQKLTSPLKDGTWEREYRNGLTTVLDWFDRYLVPPEHVNPDKTTPDWDLTSKNRAWNWLSYDRMLLFAVVYPILTPLLLWVATGNALGIGNLPLLPDAQAEWLNRGIAALGIFVLLVQHLIVRWLFPNAASVFSDEYKWDESAKLDRPGLLKSAANAILLFSGGFLLAVGVGRAGAGILDVHVTLLGDSAVATAIAFAIVFTAIIFIVLVEGASGILAIALTVSSALSYKFNGGLPSMIAGVPALLAAAAIKWNAVEKRWKLNSVHLAFTILLAVQIAIVAFLGPVWNERANNGLIFMAVLPLLNAIFDFISLGLTRYCLRRSLDDGHFKWWLYDALGALAALIGLGISMIVFIHFLNQIATAPLFDLTQLFRDLRDPNKDMLWLYITFFSTLLPTIAHLLFFVVSRALVWPGQRARLHFANRLERSDGTDLIGLSYYGFWATFVMGGLVGITYAFGFILPDAHNSFLELCIWGFESFAKGIGAI